MADQFDLEGAMAEAVDRLGEQIRFGAAYYPEYHRTERTELDLDLMQQAGFNVIRVGESVWSTWEPRDGVFELDWLGPVLDGAASRGIGVVLGTPTYAVPPWLQVAHPEIAAEHRTGQRVGWGARQEVDYSHPTFRFHAERVIRAVFGRYASHPAVIGFQVDNEPGLLLPHNPGTFDRFVRRLEERYGDVENLNREWGLTYWSHRLGSWEELWRPDGNTLPQYDLAWRQFQCELTDEFIAWQAGIVREYATTDQFVTTCVAYGRPAVDDQTVNTALDVAAGNAYYLPQGHLDATVEARPVNSWATSGVAGLFRQADRMYSSKQDRFLVTETNAGAIGGSELNLPPYPGQLSLAALALVSRGARMVEYWHWHTLPYGTETHWGGVLPHSLRPGRIYREVSQLGVLLQGLGTRLAGFRPDADVGLLWSNRSQHALRFSPNLQQADGSGDAASYQRIFDTHYRGLIDAGAQARVMHLSQALELGADLVGLVPVLVAPGLYAATDADLDLLRSYAEAGGHLILGIRTGVADQEARARLEPTPARLGHVAGVWYEESTSLSTPMALDASGGLSLSDGAHATEWADLLIVDDSEVLARYSHPQLGEVPAVTTRPVGKGRITTLGTLPSPQLARDLMHWALPDTVADQVLPGRQLPVTVASGVNAEGERLWFTTNWSGRTATVELTTPVRAAVTGETVVGMVELAPWEARVWVS